MVEAARASIQAMAAAVAEMPQSVAEPRIGGPTMKQPSFNWEADNKSSEPKTIQVREQ